MKTSCVLALLPLLCGLALAQDRLPLPEDVRWFLENITTTTSTPFTITPTSPTTAPPRGVACPFVDVRSQWLKSAYAAGENICPVRCCTTFSVFGFRGGCLRNRDYTAYTCCNETDERVKVNGKYVCRPPSSLTVVPRPQFSAPADFPGNQCPKEFSDSYPTGYTQDSFVNDASELCSRNCFWSTGVVKPPFHYYEFVDCCEDWTKLRRSDGKYLCRCDGRLYRRSRSRQLRCRPTRG